MHGIMLTDNAYRGAAMELSRLSVAAAVLWNEKGRRCMEAGGEGRGGCVAVTSPRPWTDVVARNVGAASGTALLPRCHTEILLM